MKIIDAISKIDSIKPNNYSQDDKIHWLSTLDGLVKEEIIDAHDGRDDVKFEGYNDNTDLYTEMLVPAPYDDIYIYWLEGRIDYANGEYGKANNSLSMYSTTYTAFERWYNRNHMPIGQKFKFF